MTVLQSFAFGKVILRYRATLQFVKCFYDIGDTTSPYGPPLIGALLRMSLETVRERMLERLHARGFDDLARLI